MILLLGISLRYQKARDPRKIAIIIIHFHASRQTPHSPRKLAKPMLGFAWDPMIFILDINYQTTHGPRKMAIIIILVCPQTLHTPRKLVTTMMPILGLAALALDQMILLLDINYRTACGQRNMAIIMIPVRANCRTPYSPRKLATTMIPILSQA
jgi:hypothetical protein